jgi:hypothetical protein
MVAKTILVALRPFFHSEKSATSANIGAGPVYDGTIAALNY